MRQVSMNEALHPREERNPVGIEMAFVSNLAFGRLQEAVARLTPYYEDDVETPELDRLFRKVMPDV